MRRNIRGGIKLKHLNRSGEWPSGNPRLYYRPKGQRGIAMPDLPQDAPAFLAAYVEAAGATPAPRMNDATGSIGAGVVAYLASDSYLGMAASSRMVWRRAAEDIRRRYGQAMREDLRSVHIRKDLGRLEAHPANNRLKVWRSMCRFWVDRGLSENDPAKDVRKRATPAANGAAPWTRDDFATFRAHWAIGTPERMAMELMYRTCAAIGDTTRLGPRMVENGWLTYTRQKSGSVATSPLLVPGPVWFEATDDLARCLEACPRNAVYLTTQHGAARGAKGAASWFSKACTAAGLPALSAHGIRKGRAAIFKENGAIADQRMAILGHETQGESEKYARSADLQKIISGTEKFQLVEKVQLCDANA